jgi:hypothetical protein
MSGPKTLDAKWLDPECWDGCQSLVYKAKITALESERDQLTNQLKAERDQAEASCASFRQVAEVVYEWCNSESPSDISSDWVKEKLDATDIGKQFLEEHNQLRAEVARLKEALEKTPLTDKE